MTAENFHALLDRIRCCDLCSPNLPHGTRPVLQADPSARILVAGQAPGRKVHQSGVPFDDASGDRLRQWMGIDRSTFYDPRKIAILPMGFCYPGTGKSGDLPPRPECADTWRHRLLEGLPNIKLTLVIGRYAMDWHLSGQVDRTLTETVRNWRQYGPTVVPLPHPSPRNNIWLKKNPWFEIEVVQPLQQTIPNLLAEKSG